MLHRKPAGSEENPRKKTRGKKTTAEENDSLNASKKTQPKKTPIFKPADLPHFQDGVDIYHKSREKVREKRHKSFLFHDLRKNQGAWAILRGASWLCCAVFFEHDEGEGKMPRSRSRVFPRWAGMTWRIGLM